MTVLWSSALAEATEAAPEAPVAAPAEATEAAPEAGGSAPADLARYTQPESIWAALATKRVRLVRSTWIIKQWKAGKVLPRRQELPEEAFITLEELQHMYGEGNRDGVLPIIAISFCTLVDLERTR